MTIECTSPLPTLKKELNYIFGENLTNEALKWKYFLFTIFTKTISAIITLGTRKGGGGGNMTFLIFYPFSLIVFNMPLLSTRIINPYFIITIWQDDANLRAVTN